MRSQQKKEDTTALLLPFFKKVFLFVGSPYANSASEIFSLDHITRKKHFDRKGKKTKPSESVSVVSISTSPLTEKGGGEVGQEEREAADKVSAALLAAVALSFGLEEALRKSSRATPPAPSTATFTGTTTNTTIGSASATTTGSSSIKQSSAHPNLKPGTTQAQLNFKSNRMNAPSAIVSSTSKSASFISSDNPAAVGETDTPPLLPSGHKENPQCSISDVGNYFRSCMDVDGKLNFRAIFYSADDAEEVKGPEKAGEQKKMRKNLLEVKKYPFEAKISSLPLKMEICSGAGEWVVAQAVEDKGKANWISLELRHDRVYQNFTKAIFKDASNLCMIAGDAMDVVRVCIHIYSIKPAYQ